MPANTDTFRKAYRELTEPEKVLVADIKASAGELYDLIEMAPAGREQSIAKTKLEEAVMWAVKGITG